jgi:ATPase components of ABC transporters with duplicated ATPase domains
MQRTELHATGVTVKKISNINILLGRNGAGKSRFLRRLDETFAHNTEFNVRYISPERAGVFQRDGNIMNNMERNPQWLKDVRRRNQADNFKSASANLLREIEVTYLRRLQDTESIRLDSARNFRGDRLDRINALFSNISIAQDGAELVFRGNTGEIIAPDQISSGESEAVALASEIMYFFETLSVEKFNMLLLDEPDVHLHPDLQARLARFIAGLVDELDANLKSRTAVFAATHSTPFVCALTTHGAASIGTKAFGIDVVTFSPANEQLKKVSPFFGHPLSLSLSNDAMLIVEGEDDERVWQQAARTSNGRIKLFPVIATSVDQLGELERFCAPFLASIYENPVAYSMRDGDGISESLHDVGPVVRFRLACYAVENLLVTDEALAVMGTTWPGFVDRAREWISHNEQHKDIQLLQELINSETRLRHKKIKAIRQLVCSVLDCTKPWEVVVGQALGSKAVIQDELPEFSVVSFLGLHAAVALLNVTTEPANCPVEE